MIKLLLLTGFLGCGKTTLMKNILNQYKSEKIGVIINEFGELNIDATLIKKDGIEMRELSNGSIFCSCIKGKFLKSLIEITKRDIDYLFIEASGLADPSNMQDILESIKPKLSRGYKYIGSVCIIDAVNFLEMYELLPALHNQVEYSSLVVINKTDLVKKELIDKISKKLIEINPLIKIITTSYCDINIKNMINSFSKINVKTRETTNTKDNRPRTQVLTDDDIMSYEHLVSYLKEIAPSTYRIKGFSETDLGPMEISCVGTDIRLTPWKEEIKGTEIVVIFSKEE